MMAARKSGAKPLLQAALELAGTGIRIFPLVPGGKTPLTAGWRDAATTDPETIKRWWAKTPDANIGAAMGDGRAVTDIDCKNGKDGNASLRARVNGQRALPLTLESRTPHGRHLWWNANGVRCSVGKLGPGLDVRGDGGYVVAPPSRTADGTYEWANDAPMAEMPKWLAGESSRLRLDFSPQSIPEGARNSTLTSLAGSMRRRGMSSDAIEAALLVENEQRGDPPLPKAEVRTIAKSVSRYATEISPRGVWTSAVDVLHDFERFVIFGVLPEVGRGNIHGPSGSMKSALAIDMACHIALGRAWHGRDVDAAEKIAYVASENPLSIKRRVRAWARDRKIDYEKLRRQVFVWSGSIDLNSPDSVAAFKATMPELVAMAGAAPRVWFVDTVAAAMSGDENTKAIQDAVQAIYHAVADSIGTEPLVIFVHHTGKDESREERGHSSLRAIMDTAIRVESGESTGAEPTQHEPSVLIKRGIASIRKQRDGVDGQQFAFEVHSVFVGLDDKGRPRSQVVIRHTDNIQEARSDVAAKRTVRGGGSKTITVAIREAFDRLVGKSGFVLQKDLLEAVACDLGKDATRMRTHFPRDIGRAGLTATQLRPGAPSRVRRSS